MRFGEFCVLGLEGCLIVNIYMGVWFVIEIKDYYIDFYLEWCGVLLYKNLEIFLKKNEYIKNGNFFIFLNELGNESIKSFSFNGVII